MMKADYDFDKAGKRMPYTVPENFFADLEDEILRKAECGRAPCVRRQCFSLRVAVSALTAVAAVVALLLVFDADLSGHNTLSDIEQAFADLSDEDRNYMLSVYEDDLFINQ